MPPLTRLVSPPRPTVLLPQAVATVHELRIVHSDLKVRTCLCVLCVCVHGCVCIFQILLLVTTKVGRIRLTHHNHNM